MNLKRTQNKLLKNGYLPQSQGPEFEQWIDIRENGTPISFQVCKDEVDGALKIHGQIPDRPEVDEFNSDYTYNVSAAIQLSRL